MWLSRLTESVGGLGNYELGVLLDMNTMLKLARALAAAERCTVEQALACLQALPPEKPGDRLADSRRPQIGGSLRERVAEAAYWADLV